MSQFTNKTYSSVQEVLDDGKLAWEAQSQPLVTGAWNLVSKFSV
jgi:hypothetical protein